MAFSLSDLSQEKQSKEAFDAVQKTIFTKAVKLFSENYAGIAATLNLKPDTNPEEIKAMTWDAITKRGFKGKDLQGNERFVSLDELDNKFGKDEGVKKFLAAENVSKLSQLIPNKQQIDTIAGAVRDAVHDQLSTKNIAATTTLAAASNTAIGIKDTALGWLSSKSAQAATSDSTGTAIQKSFAEKVKNSAINNLKQISSKDSDLRIMLPEKRILETGNAIYDRVMGIKDTTPEQSTSVSTGVAAAGAAVIAPIVAPPTPTPATGATDKKPVEAKPKTSVQPPKNKFKETAAKGKKEPATSVAPTAEIVPVAPAVTEPPPPAKPTVVVTPPVITIVATTETPPASPMTPPTVKNDTPSPAPIIVVPEAAPTAVVETRQPVKADNPPPPPPTVVAPAEAAPAGPITQPPAKAQPTPPASDMPEITEVIDIPKVSATNVEAIRAGTAKAIYDNVLAQTKLKIDENIEAEKDKLRNGGWFDSIKGFFFKLLDLFGLGDLVASFFTPSKKDVGQVSHQVATTVSETLTAKDFKHNGKSVPEMNPEELKAATESQVLEALKKNKHNYAGLSNENLTQIATGAGAAIAEPKNFQQLKEQTPQVLYTQDQPTKLSSLVPDNSQATKLAYADMPTKPSQFIPSGNQSANIGAQQIRIN